MPSGSCHRIRYLAAPLRAAGDVSNVEHLVCRTVSAKVAQIMKCVRGSKSQWFKYWLLTTDCHYVLGQDIESNLVLVGGSVSQY